MPTLFGSFMIVTNISKTVPVIWGLCEYKVILNKILSLVWLDFICIEWEKPQKLTTGISSLWNKNPGAGSISMKQECL